MWFFLMIYTVHICCGLKKVRKLLYSNGLSNMWIFSTFWRKPRLLKMSLLLLFEDFPLSSFVFRCFIIFYLDYLIVADKLIYLRRLHFLCHFIYTKLLFLLPPPDDYQTHPKSIWRNSGTFSCCNRISTVRCCAIRNTTELIILTIHVHRTFHYFTMS